ncbi:hypothetical protein [Amycolatopsis sp. NPDC059657]|uniref:hypothetical protein n=1 Tax=Amycolatopsis sp. NPDC059657 TaxID=3346899 RepID=UPI003670E863
MTRYTDLPKPVRAGIVIDPGGGESQKVIVLQFNPDTLERSLAPQASGAEQGDRTEALRLKGPAIETWKFTAELDASDQPDVAAEFGIHPQLAALEMLVHPSTGQIKTNQRLASLGTLEVIPVETPLTLFVWGTKRVMPMRLTELSITEEAFDADLNPYRATVGIGFRVLSVSDLPTGHKGYDLYLAYLTQKEQFAGPAGKGRLETLGNPDIG